MEDHLKIGKPTVRSSVITIAADAGLGKSSLAALFPKPIFIRAEDGMSGIKGEQPDAFPLLKDPKHLWDQLTHLIKNDHNYKTVVIDSVTALERLFIQSILEKESKSKGKDVTSINNAMGGYGAGRAAVAAMHQRVRKAVGVLNERKNMHVVFTAHADTEQLDLPDQDPFSRYSLRMGKNSLAPYIDDVDLVGFIKLETVVLGDDEEKKVKKAVSDGTRLVDCTCTASSIGKNRYGITEPLIYKAGVNPFVKLLPNLEK